MTTDSPQPPREGLIDLVRRIHRGFLNGVAEVQLADGRRRLHFVDGELYLSSDHPLAGVLGPLLGTDAAGGQPTAGAAQIRALMARVAFLLSAWNEEGQAVFSPSEGASEDDLVGPLPTVLLLMEWAAAGNEEALLDALGGTEAEVEAVPRRSAPAANAARLLDPHASVLLSRLSRTTTVGDLIRQSGTGGSRVVVDLTRLRAAGLVQVNAAEPERPEPQIPGLAPPPAAPDVVRRFAERVGRELKSMPLVLDASSHRSRLADLLSRAGGLTAYELLGIGAAASDAEVHEAYQRVARLTHPDHAARLDLAGGDRPLWFLFEQVTAAYLTLSQRERRRRYDERLAGLARLTPPRPPDGEERKGMARSYYERAEALIDAEDFHFAIELLKQAVHTHPRPEYYVLLGRAQAKNPNWLRHAMDSYRKAVELGAEDPRISVALGRLCEEMENFAEARRHYDAALSRNPADPDARAGMARLSVREERSEEDQPRRWSLASLFVRRK